MTILASIDCDKLVDDIRAAISSPDVPNQHVISAATVRYGEVCGEVNERLRHCGQLLDQGLRTEAIQECEREPNLLSVVAKLDFPERDDWLRLHARYNMVQPSGLLLDVAEALNQAYAEEQNIDFLLRQHRSLALGRAPLDARITVLRRIRAADSDNPIWEDDLKTLEAARWQQLGPEIEAAFKADDRVALAAIVKEVQSEAWSVAPDDAVVAAARDRYRTLFCKQARERLAEISRDFDEAYTAADVEAAASARNAWDEVLPLAQLDADDPLIEHTALVLEWLAQRELQAETARQYELAVKRLSQAVDGESSHAELQQSYRELKGFSDGVPPELQERYLGRIATIEYDESLQTKRDRRRAWIIGISVVSGLALSSLFIAFVIVHQSHVGEVETAEKNLSGLIQNSQLVEARSFYDTLLSQSPAVALDAKIQRLKQQLKQLEKNEAERIAAFEQSLARVLRDGPEQPASIALVEARGLARTALERQRIAEIESEIDKVSEQQQDERNEAFEAAVSNLRERITDFANRAPGDIADPKTTLDQFADEVRTLRARPGVDPLLRSELDAVVAQIEAIKEGAAQRSSQAAALAELTRSVADPERYATALRNFIRDYPTARSTPTFERVLSEEKLWLGVAAWNAVADRVGASQPSTLDSSVASELLDQGRQLSLTYPNAPQAKWFRQHRPVLSAIAARAEVNGESPLKSLRKLLTNPALKNVWIVATKDGKKYYTEEEPKKLKDAIGEHYVFESIDGFSFNTTRRRVLVKDAVYGKSPQSKLSEKLLLQLSRIDDKTWDQGFYNIITDLEDRRNHEQLDPVLRALLLSRVMEEGSKGSHSLATVLRSKRVALEEAQVDYAVNWLSTTDRAASKARRTAIEALGKVRNAQPEKIPKFARPESFRCVARLGKRADGTWQCLWASEDNVSGELVVVRPAANGTDAQMISVGKATKGVVIWSSRGALVEGRPLYVRTALAD